MASSSSSSGKCRWPVQLGRFVMGERWWVVGVGGGWVDVYIEKNDDVVNGQF